MAHGFFTCDYCKKIVFTLALKHAFEEGSEGIRFNQLLRVARKLIDSKIAAPTLIRHLKPLEKGGIVKRTRRRRQNVAYSLKSDNPLVSREDIERAAKLYSDRKDRLSSMNLEVIVKNIMQLSKLLELEKLKTWLEKNQGDEKPEILALKSEITRAIYRYYGNLLLDMAKERKAEYREVLSMLETEIDDSKKELLAINLTRRSRPSSSEK